MLLGLAIDRTLGPSQVAMAEIAVRALARRRTQHKARQRPERALDERQMLDLSRQITQTKHTSLRLEGKPPMGCAGRMAGLL